MDLGWMTEYASHAEQCGYESLVLVEHPVIISEYASLYPYASSGRMPLASDCLLPDPLDLLAALSATTSTIRLATGATLLPVHHPVVLAKRVATIDALSGGRVRLCVGVGWMREEIEACGVPFETRGRRADEAIDVLRLLWQNSEAEGAHFEGEFFAFRNAHSFPKPRFGTVPIHIGGHSPAAARRAGRRGDGFQPLGANSELPSLVRLMRSTAREAGRDPDAIELSLGGSLKYTSPEDVSTAATTGATRLVLAASPKMDDLGAAKDELSAFAERVGLLAPTTSG